MWKIMTKRRVKPEHVRREEIMNAALDVIYEVGLSNTTIAQIAMTRAYRLGNSIVIGTLSYLAIVFSGIISLLYFNETMRIEDVLGALMIIISGAIASNISLKSRIN